MANRCIEVADSSVRQIAVNGVATSLLVAFGIAGSCYTCNLLYRKLNYSRFAKYIFALCLWDIMVLVSVFGFYACPTIISGGRPWNGYIVYMYLIFYPTINIGMIGSKWMVLVITFERFLAVSTPFEQHVREIKPIKSILTAILIGAVLFNIPLWFELAIGICMDKQGKQLPQISKSQLRNDQVYNLVYRVMLNIALDGILPFLGILILTIGLKQKQNRQKRSIKKTMHVRRKVKVPFQWKKRQQLGMKYGKRAMLTAVTIKFLICYSLPTVINTLEFSSTAITYTDIFDILCDVSNILVVMHSATNWVFFCQWQKESKTLKPAHGIIRQSGLALSKEERRVLKAIWNEQRPPDVGYGLLHALIADNQELGLVFGITQLDDDLETKLRARGVGLGRFLDKIVSQWSSKENNDLETEPEQHLQEIGQIHCFLHVKLRHQDWLTMKESLVRLLCPDDNVDQQLINRVVSHIIYHLKLGFLCRSVRDKRSSSRNSAYF